jgi:hypothetical protein
MVTALAQEIGDDRTAELMAGVVVQLRQTAAPRL